jgi:hypothetical protein
MAGPRRIPREKATTALSALLENVCTGGAHADCVTRVHVFGSYARGALTVGDVDVDIEYDAKLQPAVERERIDNLVVGRDWNTPFRKALKPSRLLQVLSKSHPPIGPHATRGAQRSGGPVPRSRASASDSRGRTTPLITTAPTEAAREPCRIVAQESSGNYSTPEKARTHRLAHKPSQPTIAT